MRTDRQDWSGAVSKLPKLQALVIQFEQDMSRRGCIIDTPVKTGVLSWRAGKICDLVGTPVSGVLLLAITEADLEALADLADKLMSDFVNQKGVAP